MSSVRTRGAAAAERALINRLPAALLQAVLLRLPADERVRCAHVCRAWRAAVTDPLLWVELDITRAGGLTCSLNPARTLRKLSPWLAHPRVLRLPLMELRPNEAPTHGVDPADSVMAVLQHLVWAGPVAMSECALREVHLDGRLQLRRGHTDFAALNTTALRALLADASALTLLSLDELECTPAMGLVLLRKARLRVRHLLWEQTDIEMLGEEVPAAPRRELLRLLKRRDGLTALTVEEEYGALTPELLFRLVNVALTRRLESLSFAGYSLDLRRTPMRQLARLLRDTVSLRHLSLELCCRPRFNTAAVALG